jgi:hypothetical protein
LFVRHQVAVDVTTLRRFKLFGLDVRLLYHGQLKRLIVVAFDLKETRKMQSVLVVDAHELLLFVNLVSFIVV